MKDMPVKTVVLYDGGCSLCTSKINMYWAQDICKPLVRVDVADLKSDLHAGLKRAGALASLHVMSSEGCMLAGVAPFIEALR